jgi:small-conductance mechanosensitive channel
MPATQLLAVLVTFTGPEHSLTLFGTKLIGINAQSAHKLVLTALFIAIIVLLNLLVRWLLGFAIQNNNDKRWVFWVRQGVRITFGLLLVVGILSVWFNDASHLATFFGLVSAGLAFALQRVVTAFAGYFVILRGGTFTVGDRITMGGVRGDVIKLGFIQTTIMEMGQPPGVQADDPAMWVRSRQYTGRVVTVTNDKLFDTPVYNYTSQFPYIWEEMQIPISYKDDRKTAERIILDAANEYTVKIAELGEQAIHAMEKRYVMKRAEMQPRVYLRMTDNWVELSVRFLTFDHDVRALKDKMSRRILDELETAGIGIASGTYEIVGMPPLSVMLPGAGAGPAKSILQ